MSPIARQPEAAAHDRFDVIVVGGGIYGVTLTLEATRLGLKPLLLEKDDFGAAVSGNSLRIVHGGFRYLQNLQLARLRESVVERRWHLTAFPGLVEPLRCLMPLYGEGLRRPSAFHAAIMANRLLTAGGNRGLSPERRLPAGGVLGPPAVVERFPGVDTHGLRGGGVWYDAVMLSSERVLIEALRRAVDAGATAVNYIEAVGLTQDGGAVTGVEAVDRQSGEAWRLHAPVVINAGGPWCRRIASAFDRDHPPLYRKSLAFNVLLDIEPISPDAVAVEPRRREGRTYFVVPWKGRAFVGTHHMTYEGEPEDSQPSEAAIDAMLEALREALPDAGIDRARVRRVYPGMLPARAPGAEDMAHHPVVLDHARVGGPRGLISVSGVKWTTARAVARRVLAQALPDTRGRTPRPLADGLAMPASLHHAERMLDKPRFADVVGTLVEQESVVHLDDLVLRRMDGLYDSDDVVSVATMGADAMGLSGEARAVAFDRLADALAERLDPAAEAVRRAAPEPQPARTGEA